MDYLDPHKQRQQQAFLYIGYLLIGIAVAMSTSILIQLAYGYGVNKSGAVIQSGLLFFSSKPNPADIYTNGVRQNVQTNTRLSLTSGIYDVQIKRDGYQTWQRKINLEGGRVAHFDYPLLIPNTLAPKKISSYGGLPAYSSQSPNKRWLVVSDPSNLSLFEVYDLRSTTKNSVNGTVPASVLSKPTTAAPESVEVIEWAEDNQHLLLAHRFDAKQEFILIDRADPEKSLNLNQVLGLSPSKLTLRDKKFDQFYLYSENEKRLLSASLEELSPAPVLEQVLAYKTYAKDTFLYVTNQGAPADKVIVNLKIGEEVYRIRYLPAGTDYLVDLATYSGKMYVAAGATSLNKLYIYRDPVRLIKNSTKLAYGPVQVLHVAKPNYLSFSDTAQFIMSENGQEFAIYDLENKVGHHYTATQPLDSPQQHANWMDGHRLAYVSNGKLVMFDYDYSNQRELVPGSSRYVPSFSPDTKWLYSLADNSAGGTDMFQTSLLAPADQ